MAATGDTQTPREFCASKCHISAKDTKISTWDTSTQTIFSKSDIFQAYTLQYLIEGKHMVDLVQILLRDSLAFVLRYAAVTGQTRAQQHLLNWGRLFHLLKSMYQIINIHTSKTNLFIHPPPDQTNKTTDANYSLTDECNSMSLSNTHYEKNREIPLQWQHLSPAVSLYLHHSFFCCTKRWNWRENKQWLMNR